MLRASPEARSNWQLAVILAASAMALARPVEVRAIEVEASVSGSVIYSDNIRLAPSGEEESDFVLRAVPGITLSSSGNRYDLSAVYRLEAYYFLDQDEDTSVFHIGDLGLDLAIVPEVLTWRSSASIGQVVVNPSQTVSFTNLPITDNRTDQTTLTTGLLWQQDILGNSLEAEYTLGRTNYDDPVVQDVDLTTVFVTLASPEVDSGLGWGGRYEYEVYSYDLPPDLKRQLVEASLSWTFGGGWGTFGSYGQESDLADRTDSSLEDPIWRVGVRRRGPGSFFEAFGGERSFGTWLGLTMELGGSGPGNLLVFRYLEEPTTSASLQESRPLDEPGVVPPPVLPPGLVGPGVRQLYIRKEARLTLTQRRSRSTLSLEAFWERDEDVVPLARPDETTDVDQFGASVSYDYSLGRRTRVTGEALMSWRDFGNARFDDPALQDDDRLLRLRGTVSYRIGERTELQAWIGHEAQQGSIDGQFNYKENQLGVTIGRTF